MEEEATWPRLNLKDALSINFSILSKVGVWEPDDMDKKQRVFYQVFAVLMFVVIFLSYTASETIHMILVMGDLEKVTESSFMLLSHFAQGLKIYYYIKYNSRIRVLVRHLEEPIFQPKNYAQYLTLKIAVSDIRKTTILFILITQSACVFLLGFPLLDTKTDSSLELPITSWFPFPVDRSPNFEIAYFYQIVSLSLNVASIVAMDTTATAFMGIISGQFEILADSVQNIKQVATEKIKSNSADALQEQMNEELLSCINHHRNLKRMSAEVNSVFSYSLLSQFIVSVLVIGITMFQLTIVPFSMEFISLFMYQVSVTFEILLFCWFGNEVILKSHQLSSAAFNCDWTDNSTEFKRNLLFLMTCTKSPVKLFAGDYFTLSLETFVSILRTSWSYFAVLNNVHSEEKLN